MSKKKGKGGVHKWLLPFLQNFYLIYGHIWNKTSLSEKHHSSLFKWRAMPFSKQWQYCNTMLPHELIIIFGKTIVCMKQTRCTSSLGWSGFKSHPFSKGDNIDRRLLKVFFFHNHWANFNLSTKHPWNSCFYNSGPFHSQKRIIFTFNQRARLIIGIEILTYC